MPKIFNNKKFKSRFISWLALITLLLTLNVTWVLWGFWRTLDGINPWTNPASFLFWYGYGDLGFWFWYGYWTESWSWAWYYSDNGTDSNTWEFEITDWTDLVLVSTISGSATWANSVTIQSSVTLSPTWDNTRVMLPAWTVITNAAWGTFDALAIATWEAPVWGLTLSTWETPVAAVDFWVTWVRLNFSQPIRIDIPVTWVTGTIEVKVRHAGDTVFGTSWLTELAGDTCTNWLPWVPGATATISWGFATIYTCSASEFVTYTMSSSTSGGGWWWWGGGWTITDCTDSQLICQEYPNIPWTYRYYRLPSSAFCTGGKLWEECDPNEETTTEEEDEIIVWNDRDEHGCIGSAWYTWSETKQECVREWEEQQNEEKQEDLWPKFMDIANTWAKGYINTLAERWIVSWNGGNFYPNDNTTRAEFLKIVLRAFNHDYANVDVSNLKYVDVNKDTWQAKVIQKALSKWLISGFNDRFRPNDNVTRIEAIKMLLNAARIDVTDTEITSFTDVTISWMKKYVETSKKLWIINGQIINGKLKFRPNDPITRAETSKIVIKTMNLQ